MKRISFLLGLIMISQMSYAQDGYNVLYQITRWDSDSGRPIYKSRLVINDLNSYYYVIKGPDKIKPPFGKAFQGHSTYRNSLTGLLLYQTEPMNSPRLLIVDTIPKIEWTLYDEHKKILNYNCKKATGTYKEGLYIAWYSESITSPFGPENFGGLPGLVLELISGTNRQVTTAIEIQRQSVEIVKPNVGKAITPKKYERILNDLHHYSPPIMYPRVDTRMR